MKRIHRNFTEIFVRYFILLLVPLNSWWIIFFIFTPLTIYPVFAILGFFFNTITINNVITINNLIPIEIIRACIAGSAYYLLLILNLSTPGIKIKKRIIMILFAFASLLIINILRIVILSVILLQNFFVFVVAHQFIWYFMSTIFIILIWFSEVKIFKIKEMPFYSDAKLLYKHSFLKR